MSSETFIPYGRQSLDEEEVAAVTRVLSAPLITQGPAVEAFERALAESTGARHAVAVSSGTAALHLAYAACGLGPGDEVVTSPITFLATANAAVFCGARPVFADVTAGQPCLDPRAAEAALGPRSRLIVPVDFSGHPADWDAFRALARRRGVRLVADACHSLGAVYRGRRVGTLADLTCLSFHPVKAITTGEGGAVLTDDDELAASCRRRRAHGVVRDAERRPADAGAWYYEMDEIGWNYRITDLQCAIGQVQLGKLAGFLDQRARLARRYDELLGDFAGLELPRESANVRSAWHLYVVQVDPARRKAIFERLQNAGIGVQVHYVPLYRQPFYRRLLELEPSAFPYAEKYYAGAITLPLHPSLTASDQDRVVRELGRAIRI